MSDKPILELVVGGRGEILGRKIIKLLMTQPENSEEIDRLMQILNRRGELSLITGGRAIPSAAEHIESGE